MRRQINGLESLVVAAVALSSLGAAIVFLIILVVTR